jgi:hypothetical protein
MTQETPKRYELMIAKVVDREEGVFATNLEARTAASKLRKTYQDKDNSTEYFFI